MGNREPDAVSAGRARAGCVGAIEPIEDASRVLRGERGARVGHGEHDFAFALLKVYANRSIVVAVLDRVVYEHAYQPVELFGASAHDDARFGLVHLARGDSLQPVRHARARRRSFEGVNGAGEGAVRSSLRSPAVSTPGT